MRVDHFVEHMESMRCSRRDVLKAGAAVGGLGALAAVARPAAAVVQPATTDPPAEPEVTAEYTDDMFDVAAVKAGAWDDTAFYEKGDQRGTFNEVTPERTAAALELLRPGHPVVTYNLGELLFNGFPAFQTTPPRLYEQRLTVQGYTPAADFGGIFVGDKGFGSNEVSVHEERFEVPAELVTAGQPYTATYQIATQLDNLNHIGVGDVFYGGHRGAEIAATWGTTKLGAEVMGPVVTRGLVVDVLGLKVEQGASDALFQAANGKPVLKAGYRITVEDIDACLARQKIKGPGAGDVVLFRTGWNQLVNPKDPAASAEGKKPGEPRHPEHAQYLAGEPGIYLREARYLADRRPAIIGADSWALEVLPGVAEGVAFPVHQELIVHYGIRIGEGIVTDGLVDDGLYEFVYMVTPNLAFGATCGGTPPAALGTPDVKP